jgi:hypothetical protein
VSKLGLKYLGKDIGCGCLRLLLRKIFGSKKHVVKGDWRRLHNKELHHTYSLLNIIKGIRSRRMSREINGARIWESRAAYRVLMGKLE